MIDGTYLEQGPSSHLSTACTFYRRCRRASHPVFRPVKTVPAHDFWDTGTLAPNAPMQSPRSLNPRHRRRGIPPSDPKKHVPPMCSSSHGSVFSQRLLLPYTRTITKDHHLHRRWQEPFKPGHCTTPGRSTSRPMRWSPATSRVARSRTSIKRRLHDSHYRAHLRLLSLDSPAHAPIAWIRRRRATARLFECAHSIEDPCLWLSAIRPRTRPSFVGLAPAHAYQAR